MNSSHHHLNNYDSNGVHYGGSNDNYVDNGEEDDSAYTGTSNPSRFLARILSFLETPPHLRRVLFPLHPDLRNAGTLPSLAMPHHLKADEWCPFREGVIVDSGIADTNGVITGTKKSITHDEGDHQKDQEDVDMATDLANDHKSKERGNKKISKKANKNKSISSDESTNTTLSSIPHLVNVGYPNPITVQLPTSIPLSTRLTLHLTNPSPGSNPPNTHTLTGITAIPVPPTEPRNIGGYYWGYTVRQASSLSAIFTECPYAGGYDVSFGTSERGVPLSSLDSKITSTSSTPHSISEPSSSSEHESTITDILPLACPFRHVLLVFGGVAGLEKALEGDEILSGVGGGGGGGGSSSSKVDQTGSPAINDVSELFDFWVNLVPGQGSRTIRTEEAVWLGLMGFNNLMERIGERREK